MTITILKWIIITSATVNFGFMLFDGARGLTVGDYVRPKSGQYAGQLGPWSKLVKSIGIDPESTLMKLIFVLWGLVGLTLAFCFAINLEWSLQGLLIFSICSLWYLVPGTALSTLQIILLAIIEFLD
jgi:hypothetical protein